MILRAAWPALLLVVARAAVARADDAPPRPKPSTKLELVTLPGLRVPLPAWREVERGTDFASGVVRRETATLFGGSGLPSISLRWQKSAPIDSGFILQFFQAAFAADKVRVDVSKPIATTIAGHPAETVTISLDGRPAVTWSHWTCPNDGRVMMLNSHDPNDEQRRRLHDEVSRGVQCHTDKQAAQAASIYPRVAISAAIKRVQPDPGPPAQVYMTADGNDAYALQPGLVGTRLADDIKKDPMLRDMMTGQAFGFTKVVGNRTPHTLADGRQVWLATGESEGQKLQIAIMAWHCPANDRSFLLHFFGEPRKSLAGVYKTLGQIRCP